jgi:glycerol-3-phosphate acyltransferase PlsY
LTDVENGVWWVAVCGIVAMLGHIFPVWLGLRGGKGVATGVGVFAVLAPVPLLCAGVLFFVVVWLTRYVSLGSMVTALSVPGFVWVENLVRPRVDSLPVLIATFGGALLIVYAHRENIGRLLRGTENKF